MTETPIERLRRTGPAAPQDSALAGAWAEADVRFAASAPRMEDRFRQAVAELFDCIKPTAGEAPILNEGGIYFGCWLESTGTINAELLSRFLPEVAGATFDGFARHQRYDGCLPYKLTAEGPVFSQIQLVSPPARSVWTHACTNAVPEADLRRMYEALARYDHWLATWRDTRGTGGVEAFCTFDTGHDLSSRFWHVPDSPHGNDPAACPPDHPLLPFVAPDLTAAVACQRRYLGRIAALLGEDPGPWEEKAAASEAALFRECYDATDGTFYDRDRHGRHIRVVSDVLLRVLACEIGDDAFFDAALDRYLLNTSKFFAKFPFTSVALDDPRFDPAFDYNSWGGPSNFLSLIRAPHAFDHHGRHLELTWAMQPILSALFAMDRFPQCLSPFTGAPGFTEVYSPAILCLLDYVERLCGIQPRPDGTLWFTGLVPRQIDHRDVAHETAYGRSVDGRRFEIATGQGETTLWRDGAVLLRAPAGLRIETDRWGDLRAVTGLATHEVRGEIEGAEGRLAVSAGPNERLELRDGALRQVRAPGYVPPST